MTTSDFHDYGARVSLELASRERSYARHAISLSGTQSQPAYERANTSQTGRKLARCVSKRSHILAIAALYKSGSQTLPLHGSMAPSA